MESLVATNRYSTRHSNQINQTINQLLTMTDSRRNSNPHKIRVHVSGGINDVKYIEELIKDDRESKGWELTWYILKQRGDFGPLHDLQLGFIESI